MAGSQPDLYRAFMCQTWAHAGPHGGVGLLFRDGKIVKRMKAEELEGAVVTEALEIAARRAPK